MECETWTDVDETVGEGDWCWGRDEDWGGVWESY